MSGAFDPITVGAVTVRNRIWVSPMCLYSVERRDGVPTAFHAVHLGQFALGGWGMVMAEATAVSPEGRISPHDTGLWNDQQGAAWAPIAAFLSAQGVVPAIQLNHAGRKGSTQPAWGTTAHGSVPVADGGWDTLAPSAIAFDGYAVPRELTVAEIARIVRDFATAARRAVDAGFRAVEIHAAHGYLLHQFLSPLSNQRTDSFGGDLAARARLLLTVLREVRTRIGDDVALLVRFSATDWAEGGLVPEDIAQVALWAQEAGADLIDVSTGGLVRHQEIPVAPGYQIPAARVVRAEVTVPVSGVGLFTTAEQVDAAIDADVDVVMLGRGALRDPQFVHRAAAALGVELPYAVPQYARAPFPR